MIRTLRALFLGRLFREKILLVAFALIGALWWLSAFSTRLNAFNVQQRRTSSSLKEQQMWLDRRKAIELSAEKAAEKLESAKTLDSSSLIAAVQNLARDAGLKQHGSQGVPTTQTNGQFSVHTLDYSIQQAEWEPLKKFYTALLQRSPYIGIEHVQLQADPSGTKHTFQVRVSSVEVTR